MLLTGLSVLQYKEILYKCMTSEGFLVPRFGFLAFKTFSHSHNADDESVTGFWLLNLCKISQMDQTLSLPFPLLMPY